MTIRVVVADDHPIVRDGLRALLASLSDVEMEMVGEATTGREAVRSAVADKPDVVVMDLRMPDLDGVTATAEICRVAPEVAILVLTMVDDDDLRQAAGGGKGGGHHPGPRSRPRPLNPPPHRRRTERPGPADRAIRRGRPRWSSPGG